MHPRAVPAASRAIAGLEAVAAVGRLTGDAADPDHALQAIAERSLEAVRARTLVIGLLDGDELVLAGASGHGAERLRGLRAPLAGTLAEAAVVSGEPARVDRIPEAALARRLIAASSGLFMSIRLRSRTVGFLAMFDPLGPARQFDDEDERLLRALAVAAAAAIATASPGSEAIRASIEQAERDRARWATELHEQTLQQLASMRMLMTAACRSGDAATMSHALEQTRVLSTEVIAALRGLIVEMRPGALTGLGLTAALQGLAARIGEDSRLHIALDLDVGQRDGDEQGAYRDVVEATIYRCIQATLSTAADEARVNRAHVRVVERGPEFDIEVHNTPEVDCARFSEAVAGLSSSVELLGGRISCSRDGDAGTVVSATIPKDAPPPLTILARRIAPLPAAERPGTGA